MKKKRSKTTSYIYPWDTWFRKTKFTLIRGKHFGCQPHSMAIQVRNAAKRRGIKVSVAMQDDKLIISQ